MDAIGVKGPVAVEDAMLCLLKCLTQPEHVAQAFEAVGTWLAEDVDPLQLETLEAYSAHFLEELLPAVAVEPPEDTADTLRIDDPGDAKALERFGAALHPHDRKRFEDLLSEDGEAAPDTTLLRELAPDGAPSLIRLVHRDGAEIHIDRERRHLLEETEQVFRDSFGVTEAELHVIRGLVTGERPRDIAARLGKSYETVRSQIKSIGEKLGASTHGEILSAVRSGDALVGKRLRRPATADEAHGKIFETADGRLIEYDVFGAADGKPLLYFHDFLGGRHWPPQAEESARTHGFRVISVSRAGFAASSPPRRTGHRALDEQVADYALIANAEARGPVLAFAEGSGMSSAYSFALAHPDKIKFIVGLNAMPPISGMWTIKHCAPGIYRNGALAALYAPKTIRLLGKLGMKRVAASNDRTAFGEVMNVSPDAIAETDQDFDAYMKDNLADSIAGNADGVAVDCTYMAHDWSRSDERLNSRPTVVLLCNHDYPFVATPPLERFSALIGATIKKLDTGYARRLFDISPVMRELNAANDPLRAIS